MKAKLEIKNNELEGKLFKCNSYSEHKLLTNVLCSLTNFAFACKNIEIQSLLILFLSPVQQHQQKHLCSLGKVLHFTKNAQDFQESANILRVIAKALNIFSHHIFSITLSLLSFSLLVNIKYSHEKNENFRISLKKILFSMELL